MKFKFQLEPVLSLRKREEDQLRKEMAPLVAALNQAQERIDSLTRNLGEFNQNKMFFLKNATRLSNFSLSVGYYREVIERSIQEREKIENELTPFRERLSNAMKRRRAIELIRDREAQKYKKILRKKEQKELDELAGRL